MTTSTDHWLQPASSWCAKTDRAAVHLESLRQQVDEFRRSEPYTITEQPTEQPNRVAHVIHYHRDVPPSISTTIGDVLHNLRAALENLAFELARLSHGGTLTGEQERCSTFPICATPDDYTAFHRDRRRVGLYNARGQEALRAVQPFAELEQAHQLGVATDQTHEDRMPWTLLHRLDRMWNKDKHRRLTPILWWPEDLIHWSSNDRFSRRRIERGDGTLADGSTLFYVVDSSDSDGKVIADFNLVLRDDPAFPLAREHAGDLLEVLGQFHRHVSGPVLRQVAAIMSR